jgi:hypothetical protein
LRQQRRAWLGFEVGGNPDDCSIRQTANFEPLGLAGLAYWYGIYLLPIGIQRDAAGHRHRSITPSTGIQTPGLTGHQHLSCRLPPGEKICRVQVDHWSRYRRTEGKLTWRQGKTLSCHS